MHHDTARRVRGGRQLVRWMGLGAIVGVLAGLSSAGFLVALDWVTDTRDAHRWLTFGLPLAGLAVGLAYHHFGGRSGEGNQLILDEIHDPQAWVPRRLAPLVFGGTIVTHLFGGSAGREGTALQMSGSLTDGFARAVGLPAEERRTLLIAALAGGFGAVFGVPFAGVVFGLEVEPRHRVRWYRLRSWTLVPAVVAAFVGDQLVRRLGVEHTELPTVRSIGLAPLSLVKVAVAGIAFGLTARAFVVVTHRVRAVLRRVIAWTPGRPVVGGVAVVLLTALVGTHDYLGLSIPLITASVFGGGVAASAFAWKLVFTAVTVGSGLPGGEVTPLFVIGATLGVSLGRLLDLPTPLLAAVGLVAVFGAAAKTPVACIVMGVELFGCSPLLPLAVTCVLGAAVSGRRGIYSREIGLRVTANRGSGSRP